MPEYKCVCKGEPGMAFLMESKSVAAYGCAICGRCLMVNKTEGGIRCRYVPETIEETMQSKRGPALAIEQHTRRVHAYLDLLGVSASLEDPAEYMEKVRDELDLSEVWLHGYHFILHTDS